MMSDNEFVEIEGFLIEIETIEEYIPGRNVKEISDIHLQNARWAAWVKLKELALTITPWHEAHGAVTMRQRGQVKFYQNMYKLTSHEVHRRFMRAHLISIPFANPKPIVREEPHYDDPF